MRKRLRTALLAVVTLVVSACQFTRAVPDDVQAAVRAVLRDVQPAVQISFAGLDCMGGPLASSVIWTAETDLPGDTGQLARQLRSAAVKHGWQPYQPDYTPIFPYGARPTPSDSTATPFLGRAGTTPLLLRAVPIPSGLRVQMLSTHFVPTNCSAPPNIRRVLAATSDDPTEVQMDHRPLVGHTQQQGLQQAADRAYATETAIGAALGQGNPQQPPETTAAGRAFGSNQNGALYACGTQGYGLQWRGQKFPLNVPASQGLDAIAAAAGPGWRVAGTPSATTMQLRADRPGGPAIIDIQRAYNWDRGQGLIAVEMYISTECVPPSDD